MYMSAQEYVCVCVYMNICVFIEMCKILAFKLMVGIVIFPGLRVAYLAGKYVPSLYADAAGAQYNGIYHEDDVDALRAFADEPSIVDLFLSYPYLQMKTLMFSLIRLYLLVIW